MRNILWFKDITLDDVVLVGGKNASLGEMIQELKSEGIAVPDGFATTSRAYFDFLEQGGIRERIRKILAAVNIKNIKDLHRKSKEIQDIVLKTPFPKDLNEKISESYVTLSGKYKERETAVAVRSSATLEDMPTASFAGMQETYLNVKGKENLLLAIKKCFASLFSPRSISYRAEKGFSHDKVALSCGVQKMVNSDTGASGVIFTLDTESGFSDIVLINATYGLGEMIVQGRISPDEYIVFKRKFLEGYPSIIKRKLGSKRLKMICNGGKERTKVIKTPKKEQESFVLSEKEVLKLASWAITLEKHYSKKAGRWQPMDIEWAKDGPTGRLFFVQARPETVHRGEEKKSYVEYKLENGGNVLVAGVSIGEKIGQGKANIIKDIKEIGKFKKGEILVTKMTDPDWEPIMTIAAGIVTDEGGRTCFSGDTKILTNKGLLFIEEITKKFKEEEIKALSLNRETLRLEWKRVIGGFQRKSPLIQVKVSQTGRAEDNILNVTPDHNFLTFKNRKLAPEEIQNLVKNKEYVLSLQNIPPISQNLSSLTPDLSYFLGGILTDGHIYLRKTHGEVQFIQKRSPEKIKFIERMKKCLKNLFNYSFHQSKEQISGGIIRGKKMEGSASRYRCYSKEIATYFKGRERDLSKDLLSASKESLYNFLAGVIDGDGTYNKRENKINIFCSDEELLQCITITCLRLGISFHIGRNRNIYNIQIIDKVKEILRYTNRVKGEYRRVRFGTRFLSAKQLLGDIISRVNYKGRILPYVKNNLLIDIEKIRNYVIPLIKGEPENHILTQIINAPLKMLRVNFKSSLGTKDVYNIEVEDNHNYVVFTNSCVPIIVENCHSAIVSRELGIPCIVGTRNGTRVISQGKEITIDCSRGTEGYVLEGKIPFSTKKYRFEKLPKTETKICLNVGSPGTAFKSSFLPVDGVGLARTEFIFASMIKIHPLALIHFDELKDKKIKEQISAITAGYKDKKEFFIEKLAQGVSQIAAAFYPKEVIVRFSDFKTNEYAELIGGKMFEPVESNPMIGWRGASRYYSKDFKEAFLLECKAIRRAREGYGLKNVSVMVPFCRTVEEGKKVIEIIKKAGLINKSSADLRDLSVYAMCEIPSNVIMAKEFLEIFDGMSIGSNDLTQLTLGIDRDSAILVKVGDERNEAVKKLIREAIKECNNKEKYSGICGDAPSTFKDFAKFLVECGIKSISINPDVAIKTRLVVAEKEKERRNN